jgi:hypothetical protein
MRLMFLPGLKKAYLSFPMTNLRDGRALAAVERFRTEIKRYFICFDPGDLEEKNLGPQVLAAAEAGRRFVSVRTDGRHLQFETAELLAILPDIDGQIYARDFKLIDQSDMIVSLIPPLPAEEGQETRPGLSSGVERELQHAHEAAKDVFVIWLPEAAPSPFVTQTATRVFRTVREAVEFFLAGGYVPDRPGDGLFA